MNNSLSVSSSNWLALVHKCLGYALSSFTKIVSKIVYLISGKNPPVPAKTSNFGSCNFPAISEGNDSCSEHPFGIALKKFRNFLGEQWPPKASFEDWPEEWLPYVEMGNKMAASLRDLSCPQIYRDFILDNCEKVNVAFILKCGSVILQPTLAPSLTRRTATCASERREIARLVC